MNTVPSEENTDHEKHAIDIIEHILSTINKYPGDFRYLIADRLEYWFQACRDDINDFVEAYKVGYNSGYKDGGNAEHS